MQDVSRARTPHTKTDVSGGAPTSVSGGQLEANGSGSLGITVIYRRRGTGPSRRQDKPSMVLEWSIDPSSPPPTSPGDFYRV